MPKVQLAGSLQTLCGVGQQDFFIQFGNLKLGIWAYLIFSLLFFYFFFFFFFLGGGIDGWKELGVNTI